MAPSAHVVAWSRLGASYRTSVLDELVADGSLVELHSMLRPAEDLALYRAEMAVWPGVGELAEWQAALAGWVEANDDTRRDILAQLHDEGPCTARVLPDTTLVPWRSSGWNDDRNVRRLLDMMVQRGEVAVAGAEGRDKLWDLAERVYPDDPRRAARGGVPRPRRAAPARPGHRTTRAPPSPPASPTTSARSARRRASRASAARGGSTRRTSCDLDAFEGRTALLSPLDRLVFDRRRMADLFEFDYALEMYKPAAKRRWGYWALPVLHGDALVGKVDATADRADGVLRVDAVHEDGRWSRTLRSAVDDEIASLGRWLGLVVERS